MNTERPRFPAGTAVMLVMHLILCVSLQMYPEKNDVQNRELHPLGGVIMIAAFLMTCFAMIWEMRLFTRKTSRIPDYVSDFMPCLMQIVLLAAGEITAAFLLNNPRLTFWSPAEGFFWAIACAVMLLLSGIVTFVTGAARTVMYHDEKR